MGAWLWLARRRRGRGKGAGRGSKGRRPGLFVAEGEGESRWSGVLGGMGHADVTGQGGGAGGASGVAAAVQAAWARHRRSSWVAGGGRRSQRWCVRVRELVAGQSTRGRRERELTGVADSGVLREREGGMRHVEAQATRGGAEGAGGLVAEGAVGGAEARLAHGEKGGLGAG